MNVRDLMLPGAILLVVIGGVLFLKSDNRIESSSSPSAHAMEVAKLKANVARAEKEAKDAKSALKKVRDELKKTQDQVKALTTKYRNVTKKKNSEQNH